MTMIPSNERNLTMTDQINPRTLVEVARGRMKPLGKLTPAEARRAERILDQKRHFAARWTELVQVLGPEWVPRTKLVLAGTEDKLIELTLSDLENEIKELEAAIEFKRLTNTGSQN